MARSEQPAPEATKEFPSAGEIHHLYENIDSSTRRQLVLETEKVLWEMLVIT